MFHGSHDVQDKADVQTKFTYLLCHYIFLLLPCFTMFLLIHWTSTNFRWIPIRMIITKSPDSYRLSDNQTKIYSASLANVIKLTYLFTFSTWVLVPCIGLAYHSIFLSHTRICYQDNLWRPITWWTNEWSWAMFRLNPLHWSYCISNCSLLYKNKRICFIRKMWLRITIVENCLMTNSACYNIETGQWPFSSGVATDMATPAIRGWLVEKAKQIFMAKL